MSAPTTNFPVEIVLWGIQSPINIGMVMRITEMYQLKLAIYDQFGILKDQNKLKTISDFSCGAYDRQTYRVLDRQADFKPGNQPARIIATSIDAGSISLEKFEFKTNDCILFGNEYDGIPGEITQQAACCLHIPTPQIFLPKHKSYSPIDATRDLSVANNGTPSHNVAVSVGIIAHAVYMQG